MIAMKLGTTTVQVPDCTPTAYAHWYEVGPLQVVLVLGILLAILGVTIFLVNLTTEVAKTRRAKLGAK